MRSSFLPILAVLSLFGAVAAANVFGNEEGFRRASLESRQNKQERVGLTLIMKGAENFKRGCVNIASQKGEFTQPL